MIGVIVALLALGGGTAYYFGKTNKFKEGVKTGAVQTEESVGQQAQATEVPQQRGGSSRSSAPTPVTNELADWQEYKNERYFYKIRYPADWYFIKEGYSPPPPTSIKLSSISDPYPSAGVDYLSVGIDVDQALGRTLDNYEEIASLKTQYYQEIRLTVGDEPAVKIAVPDPNSAEPISIYIKHQDYIYRIVWSDNTDDFVQNRKLLEKILQGFNFTD